MIFLGLFFINNAIASNQILKFDKIGNQNVKINQNLAIKFKIQTTSNQKIQLHFFDISSSHKWQMLASDYTCFQKQCSGHVRYLLPHNAENLQNIRLKACDSLGHCIKSNAFNININKSAVNHKILQKTKASVSIKWQRTNGPDGGTIGILGTAGKSIYAGTEVGLFKSSDNGKHWTQVIKDKWVISFASDDNILYVGTNSSGILESSDGGINWKPVNQKFNGSNVSSISIQGKTMYIVVGNNQVYKTSDAGKSWALVNQGLQNKVVNTVLAYGNTVYAGTQKHGVFKTTDGGQHWVTANSSIENCYVVGFTVSGNTLYVGTDLGVFKTTDQGKNWEPCNNGLNNLQSRNILSIITQQNNIYAATPNGIYRTSNAGNSWVSIGQKSPAANAVAVIEGTIFAGTGNDGVLKYNPELDNWTESNTGLANTYVKDMAFIGNTVYATSISNEISKSTDKGNSWINMNQGIKQLRVTSVASQGNTLYIGTFLNGIYKSTNGGVTWLHVNQMFLNNAYIRSLKTIGNTVYAGTPQGIFILKAGSTHWSNTLPGVYEAETFTNIDNTVYAGTPGGQIFKSSDNGQHWSKFSPSPDGWGIVAMTSIGNTLFVVTDSSIFKSSDGGNHWIKIDSGLPDIPIQALTTDGSNLYVGVFYGGVYKSSDGGEHWIPYGKGISNTDIQYLGVNQNTLYAGTGGNGVFKADLF